MRHAQILRVIDSLQLTANHSVATPVNWKHGQDVVVVPTLTDEQANDKVHSVSCPVWQPATSLRLWLHKRSADCRHAHAVRELQEGRVALRQGLSADDSRPHKVGPAEAITRAAMFSFSVTI